MRLTWEYITDNQAGFRAFKREVIEKLHLSADGYEIETELTVKGLKNGFKHQEMRIDCRKRMHDYSKLRILQDGLK